MTILEQNGTVRPRSVRVVLPARTAFGLVAVGVGIVVSLWALAKIWLVFLVLICALILAGTLGPIVVWLEQHRVHRGLAILAVLLGLLAAIVGFGFLIIPACITEVKQLMKEAPDLQQRIAAYMEQHNVLADRADDVRNAKPAEFLSPLSGSIVHYARSMFDLIAYLVTTIALAFYLIADRERVRGFAFALVPRSYHVRLARLLKALGSIVGGYMRGQAVTSVMIGAFTYFLLTVMGVQNALILAILAGITDLIPYVGAVLATAPAILVSLSKGLTTAIIVLVVLVLYQELESRLVVPRVYGRTMRLSPVAVTIALMTGGLLFNVIGALVALPIAAGIRAAVEELRIDLPGNQPGETQERVREAQIESRYISETKGATAAEAGTVAIAIADELEDEREKSMGKAGGPLEEHAVQPRRSHHDCIHHHRQQGHLIPEGGAGRRSRHNEIE
jgi:predicted PurR-regulated permease PerM